MTDNLRYTHQTPQMTLEGHLGVSEQLLMPIHDNVKGKNQLGVAAGEL